MENVVLKAQKRETGKQISKRIRREGLIPGVYYAKGDTGIPISAKPISLRTIVYTSDTKMINLQIEDDATSYPCVLKEVKFDPLTDKMIHFDLIGVTSDKKMHFEIPIILNGQAIGVRDGGVVQHTLHKVNVECLPVDMPNHFAINISDLKLGKSIHLSDIQVPNIHFLAALDSVVVTCVPPRVTGESKVETTAVVGEEKAV